MPHVPPLPQTRCPVGMRAGPGNKGIALTLVEACLAIALTLAEACLAIALALAGHIPVIALALASDIPVIALTLAERIALTLGCIRHTNRALALARACCMPF